MKGTRNYLLSLMLVCQSASLSGCSPRVGLDGVDDRPPAEPMDVSMIANAVPRAEPLSRYGNPESYTVNGKRYQTLKNSRGYVKRGIASWYGAKFHGRRTSSGEIYDLYKMTAAHKRLPLPTYVQVTNLQNNRSVIVKVNDRGPFHEHRIIDLSYAAAARLGILETGTGLVEVSAIDPSVTQTETKAVIIKTGTADNTRLFLQVGAFSNRDNAERFRNKLEISNPGEIRIIETSSTRLGQLYKVQIGPLASAGEADRLARELASLGISNSQTVAD